MAASNDSMFTEAIAAVRAGDHTHARELLTRLLRVDSSNPEYWLWLSTVVESERERIYCLQSVLKQDPTNRAALRGIVIFGAQQSDQSELSGILEIPHRKIVPPTRSSPINVPGGRWILLAVPIIVILGIFLVGNILFRPRPTSVAPDIAPATATLSPTPAMTATHTPVPIESVLVRTPIPTELSGTPLAIFAGVLPTPTPYWGVTPNSVYEAYTSSVAALKRGDFLTSIQNMEQVLKSDPTLADAYFIRGEAYRNLGLFDEAEIEFQLALNHNPTLAAAHLGLARIQMLRDPGILSEEYNIAISYDPKLLPAYLEQAEFLSRHSQWGVLEELARNGLRAGVKSPLLQLYEGSSHYYLRRYEEALDSIILATSSDESLLEAYYYQGVTLIALGRYEESISPLKTYTAYAGEDIQGWNAIGVAFYNLDDYGEAENAFSYTLLLDEQNYVALFNRGLLYLDLDRHEEAVADFNLAKEINPQSDQLEFARARAFFALDQNDLTLESLNIIFERSLEPNLLADAYALQALYYVNQSPPYVSEAIDNWEIILQLENVSEERKIHAQNELTTLIQFP